MHQSTVVEGYIWRTVIPLRANCFIRGIRSWSQDGAEERLLQIQNTWGPLMLGPLWWPLPTIFITGDPRYHHVSSTLVRETCGSIKPTDEPSEGLLSIVPENIAHEVCRLYGSQKKD
jgi:phosphopantetheine adenylyltransferase